MTICLTGLTGACTPDPGERLDPLFKDVARNPPLTKQETNEYLVRNDRPLAVWIEEMAEACDEYGCV